MPNSKKSKTNVSRTSKCRNMSSVSRIQISHVLDMSLVCPSSVLQGSSFHMVDSVGQCDLDLGSSHYIRADTGLPQSVNHR